MSEASGEPRSSRPARVRSLSCPNCGGVVSIHASGQSVTAICNSCGAVLDVANDAVRLIAAAQVRIVTPLIPIGTRGTLAGTEWQVVGYQKRSNDEWVWEEYLLFNPYRGFRFLGQDHGHFTLYCMLREEVGEGAVIAGDRHAYRADATGRARTDYVLGEFYWRVRAGDVVSFAEFVAPPLILSMERGESEVTWSRGIYIEPEVIRAAFALASLPARQGRAAHQPGWAARHAPALNAAPTAPRKPLWKTALVFLLLLVLVEVVPFGQDYNRVVFQQDFIFRTAGQERNFSSASFIVPDQGGDLALEVSAPIWPGNLRLGLALAADDGSRRFDFPIMFAAFPEEDAPSPSIRFPSVPGGSYKILADADASAMAQPALGVTVRVRRHPADAGGFFIALLLILMWPTADSLARWFGGLFRRSED